MTDIVIDNLDSLVFNIKVSKTFRLRVFLAVKLIQLAALILGGKTNLEVE